MRRRHSGKSRYNKFLSKKDGITVNTEKIHVEYGYTPVHITGIKDPVVPKPPIQQETYFPDKVQGEVLVKDQDNVSIAAKKNFNNFFCPQSCDSCFYV